MANIMSQVRFSNNTSRNSFDLSHKVAFTAKAGELLPFVVQEVLPKDKFVHKPKWFTRTNPLNTAAYTRLTEYIDYYFVPTRILWNKSDQFFANLPDSQHALGLGSPNRKVYEEHPYFLLSDVAALLNRRNFIFTESTNGNVVSDEFAYSTDVLGMNRGFQGSKLLQYLGYGDFSQYFNIDGGNPSEFPYDVKLNPFPLLAYQSIYEYFERFDQWEPLRSDFYNIDYNQGVKIDVSSLLTSQHDMFDMRYANFKKDLFFGLLPESQYGDEAYATISSLGGVSTYRFARAGSIDKADIDKGNVKMYNGLLQNSVEGSSSQSIDGIAIYTDNLGKLPILALRQAEALQRYKEIKQSNHYDYRSQMRALWNAKVSRERSNMPYRIGGFVNGINIDEVVNTSITDNDDMRQSANIAGKGAGAGQGYIDFESEEHGYIIGIYKVCPELDYIQRGIPRLLQKCNISDYANPVFDKLGMEELPVSELYFDSASYDAIANRPILGYVPRYYEYKTAIDKVMGGFATDSYQTWVAPLSETYYKRQFNRAYSSVDKTLITYGWFKINPAILNSIFTSQIRTFWDSSEFHYQESNWENEQFLINMFDECTAVRNLDYNGLPY